jgi:trehalose 6-phosphate synthase/phosphatase
MRMNHLRRRERIHDVNYWMKSFFKAMGTLIAEDGEEVLPTTIAPVTMMDFDEILTEYIGGNSKLVLLLDYDGTLAPIAAHPDLAILPRDTKEVLQHLANMSDVYIAIISGRSVSNVKQMVGIDNITYAGSHGLEIEHPDGTKFVHPMPVEIEGKVSQLIKNLQEEVCHDGAWVENKGALLTYHYRETPNALRPEMIERAKQLILGAGFNVGVAHCALEARPQVQWNKGRASIYILRTAFGLDWSERVRIIYAGDDVTDEDAMQALKGMAITYRVTASHSVRTAANRRLPSTDSILTMLKFVEQHMNRREVKKSSSTVKSPLQEPLKAEVNFQ